MNGYFIRNNNWLKILLLAASITYIYVFMEWIFFVTKPSFMSAMNAIQSVEVFLFASFVLVLPGLFTVLLLWGISKLLSPKYNQLVLLWLGVAIPTFISTALVFILIDNFIYTVFGFGVVSTVGAWRSTFAFLFAGIFITFFRYILKFTQSSKEVSRFPSYFVLFLLFASIINFALRIPNLQLGDRLGVGDSTSNLPNIILLGIDGVNAENMSVYGYERDTTPNITALSLNALIVENAFSNSGNTGGSLTSLLTGKLPIETRVVYPPDILLGEDAYQHFPGILKQMGYHTVQVTMPNFGDAYDRNIKDGFDIANFRSENTIPYVEKLEKLGGGSGFYFSALILQRITDRLKHAFYIEKMENSFEMVTEPTKQITEKQRFNAMISYLNDAKEPVFIHVHMLGTHGSLFTPRKNVFSQGKEQNQTWMVDFYDDAILDADKYVGDLFHFLTETGKLNNTIVILYSDHGMAWNPRNRVPLIIWFPDNEHTGKVHENVQLIDIAPTLLDYIGVTQPTWMHGQSILENNFPSVRSIISANTSGEIIIHDEDGWRVDVTKNSPPFYQLGTVNLVVCNKWFSLNLRNPGLTYGDVTGSTVTCNADDIPSPERAQKLILQQLADNEYDISSYPKKVPITADTLTIPSNGDLKNVIASNN